MKNLILLSCLWLITCTPKPDKYALFRQQNFATNTPIISVKQVSTFQKILPALKLHDSVYIAEFLMPFDFEQRKFEEDNFTHLIPLRIFNPGSYVYLEIHCGNTLKFNLLTKDKVADREGKILSEKEIRTVFRQNILNRGKDTHLADSPSDAINRIFIKSEQSLQDAAWLLAILADEFLQILKIEEVSTTQWSKNYPLYIFLGDSNILEQEKNSLSDTTLLDVIEIPDDSLFME